MVPAIGLLVVAIWQTSTALNVDRHQKPGDIVRPEIVIPGEWMVDQPEQFLFLPLTVPADVDVSHLKVMSNGESLLVVVTETPQEEPQTNALRKYKLVMEAIKQEAGHDEDLLKAKLQTWLDTEDDDEVKVHIRAALDSLTDVQKGKAAAAHKSISVSLGDPHKKAASSLLELAATATQPTATVPTAPSHTLPALLRGSTQQKQQHHHFHATRIIKESFAVEIPYPVPLDRIFLLRTTSTVLMATMPLMRKSLEASGISTGGKAFKRVPVFNQAGQWIAGPKSDIKVLAADLDLKSVAGRVGFQPLSD